MCNAKLQEFWGPSNTLRSLRHEVAWLHWKLNQSLQHEDLPATKHNKHTNPNKTERNKAKQCQQEDKSPEEGTTARVRS